MARSESQGNPASVTTKEARLFVRLALSLGVGVAVGLAPFLGKLSVPGFVPLLAIFPSSLQGFLIPISAFMMGSVAAIVQYYAGSIRSKRSVDDVFKRASRFLAFSFLLLVVSYFFLVVQVPIPGAPSEAVVIGLVKLNSCCKDASSNLECVEELSLFPGAIESCWGSQQVGLSKAYLSLLYLIATGSFGAIIGLIVLKTSKRATPKRRPRKEGAKSAAGTSPKRGAKDDLPGSATK